MAHQVETMFYTREAPWHGLGVHVNEALSAKEALLAAGLDWEVTQREIQTSDNLLVPGYKANIRSSDQEVLGVVSDRYRIIQNQEAFAFTDRLLGEGVRYETAGSLQKGRRVWLLARLPQTYQIAGDAVTPYLVFSNCHDGTGAVKVAMTPVRVVCQNTLNLALAHAQRSWSATHTGNITSKLDDAKKTLLLAEHYMEKLQKEAASLQHRSLADSQVKEYIHLLLPEPENASPIQQRNLSVLRTDLASRYFDAPDLAAQPKSAWRFLNAVSDFATHSAPLRKTKHYKEAVFAKTIEGNPLTDKAYELIQAS